jgi:exopolysaccharide biosynthesis protein
MTTGDCYGNIVSDGRTVQTSLNVTNANFGIRADGSIVVGYIPEEEVMRNENPFKQLISGVIWLVRNGSNYVNESMTLESTAHEDTGNMDTFVNVMSARTAIGHDSRGRLVMMQVEGQTGKRGCVCVCVCASLCDVAM